eukprot:1340673-Amorphochlora_amoeboformis.AAC.2
MRCSAGQRPGQGGSRRRTTAWKMLVRLVMLRTSNTGTTMLQMTFNKPIVAATSFMTVKMPIEAATSYQARL